MVGSRENIKLSISHIFSKKATDTLLIQRILIFNRSACVRLVLGKRRRGEQKLTRIWINQINYTRRVQFSWKELNLHTEKPEAANFPIVCVRKHVFVVVEWVEREGGSDTIGAEQPTTQWERWGLIEKNLKQHTWRRLDTENSIFIQSRNWIGEALAKFD